MDTQTPASASSDLKLYGLQTAITTLLCTLGSVPGLPISQESFTHVDHALLKTMNSCVSMLAKRHFPFQEIGVQVDEGSGDRANRLASRDKSDFEDLEGMITNLLGHVQGLREIEAEDEGWVDVVKEDVVDGQQQVSERITVVDMYGTSRTFPLWSTLQKIRQCYRFDSGFEHYEIVDAEERTRVFVEEGDWEERKRAGMRFLLVEVLDGLSAVETGRCPIPGCGAGGDGAGVEVCEAGGWICKECGVWFDHGRESSVPEVKTALGAVSHQLLWKQEIATRLLTQTEASPFKNFPTVENPFMRDVKSFKFVKTYPLVTLDKRAASVRESGEEKLSVYKCQRCSTHLALEEEIISKNFRGIHGKACLFDRLYNVIIGKRSERRMTTGKHIAVDVHCRQCREYVGWAYEHAEQASESYKIGKFILEMGVVRKYVSQTEREIVAADISHRLVAFQMKRKLERAESLTKGDVEVSGK